MPDRKELIKIISTKYLLISLITRKYLVGMILINLSGRVDMLVVMSLSCLSSIKSKKYTNKSEIRHQLHPN
jgi:hypothetical protein